MELRKKGPENPKPPVYPFVLPKLRYEYSQLEYSQLEPLFSEESLRTHHQSIQGEYVKNLNATLADLKEFHDLSIEEILRNIQNVPDALRKEVQFQGGGHANHQFFWKILSPPAGQEPQGELLKKLNEQFGSVAIFKEKFEQAVQELKTEGWVFLVLDPKEGRVLKIFSGSGNESVLYHGTPGLLIIDAWEHSYSGMPGLAKSEYLKNYWKVVDWDIVGQRLEGILSGKKQL
jgi:Fe-Mn family superoxide dismutase